MLFTLNNNNNDDDDGGCCTQIELMGAGSLLIGWITWWIGVEGVPTPTNNSCWVWRTSPATCHRRNPVPLHSFVPGGWSSFASGPVGITGGNQEGGMRGAGEKYLPHLRLSWAGTKDTYEFSRTHLPFARPPSFYHPRPPPWHLPNLPQEPNTVLR